MNFTQLMAFETVARQGSITKAAQLLRVSQPSVSKHLKNLEERYRVKLFERNGGAMELTDEGRTFLRHVNAILFHLEKLQEEVKRPADLSKSDPLKVAGSYAASAHLLPSLLARFERKHRETPIILRTGSTRSVKAMLLNSEVEVAVLNASPVNPNLASEPFREEKLVMFAAPNHPLVRKKVLSLSELNKAPFVSTGGKGRASTTEQILKRFVDQGLKAKVAVRCATPEAVKAIVKNGIGVGILYNDVVTPEIRRKVFKRLELPGLRLAGKSHIVYYKDRPLSPHAREFLALLRGKADPRVAQKDSPPDGGIIATKSAPTL
ncbi:MAG TPA: LysR family transcriptional regulator [Candidatus Binatia bacterium]|nr:LysR family transcriptional regulator [Candidatus Binatia bacterium]